MTAERLAEIENRLAGVLMHPAHHAMVLEVCVALREAWKREDAWRLRWAAATACVLHSGQVGECADGFRECMEAWRLLAEVGRR